MRVLIDTNVLLDVILEHAAWVDEATALLDRSARGEIEGYVAAHSVTTIYYIVERERDRRTALTALGDLLSTVAVAELGGADFHRALALGLRDFEDAVQAAACLRIGADFLATRNAKDFKGAAVTTRTPGEILALLTGDTGLHPR